MTFLQFLFITLVSLPLLLQQQRVSHHASPRRKSISPIASPQSSSSLQQRHHHSHQRQKSWVQRIAKLSEPKVPLTAWAVVVFLFYLSSVLGNAAFSYHIPMPLHIIFKSGSLVVSMALGYLVMKKRYLSNSIALHTMFPDIHSGTHRAK